MKLTKHGKMRMKQRGFSKFVLDIILNFGNCKDVPGGAMKIYLGNKECQNIVSELKRAIQVMDKARNGSIIIIKDKIVTVYKN